MDSSPHSTRLAVENGTKAVATGHRVAATGVSEGAVEERAIDETQHIHLPNPSLWPLFLCLSILLAVIGVLFIPDAPWLTIVSIPLVITGILGWVLENPSVHRPVEYVTSPKISGPLARFQIGLDVFDRDGTWLGTVQSRVGRYLVVGRGGLSLKTFYISPQFIHVNDAQRSLQLEVSIDELLKRDLDHVPDDLYASTPEPGIPRVEGIPMFARGPLSPAETGHYNYGPNYPGINTDAAGSYLPDEVRPQPQRYVGDRRALARYNARRATQTSTVSVE